MNGLRGREEAGAAATGTVGVSEASGLAPIAADARDGQVAIGEKERRTIWGTLWRWGRYPLGLAFCGVVGLSAYGTLRSSAAREAAEKQVARARAMGIPLTKDEFVASIQVPPERNAAPEMTRIIEIMRSVPKPKPEDGGVKRPNAGQLAELRTLAKWAARKGALNLPKDYRDLASVEFPELGEWKDAAKSLGLAAEDASRAGRVGEFRENIEAMRDVSSVVSKSPFLIAFLVSRSIDGLSEIAMRNGLRANPSPEMREAVEELARSRRRKPSPAFAFRSEIASSYDITRSQGKFFDMVFPRDVALRNSNWTPVQYDFFRTVFQLPTTDFVRSENRRDALKLNLDLLEIAESERTVSDKRQNTERVVASVNSRILGPFDGIAMPVYGSWLYPDGEQSRATDLLREMVGQRRPDGTFPASGPPGYERLPDPRDFRVILTQRKVTSSATYISWGRPERLR